MLRYDFKTFAKDKEHSSEIRNTCQFLVLFWYIVHVLPLACSCRRLYSTCCCCFLLKQVIDSHQFKPTFVSYVWLPVNTFVGLNWCASITSLRKEHQQVVLNGKTSE